MSAHGDPRIKLDLFLDGDLSEEESREILARLEHDASLRDFVRDDQLLADALRDRGLFEAPATAAPVVRFGWVRWGAAAGLLAVAFLAGSRTGGNDEEPWSEPALSVARSGDVLAAPDDASLDAVVASGASLRLSPGTRARVVDGGPLPLFALQAGTLEVRAGSGEARIEVAGFGTARVTGTTQLSLSPMVGDGREPYLLVHSFTGSARLEEDGLTEDVARDEPRIFFGGGPRYVSDFLARLDELQGDEGLMVMTSREAKELLTSLDQEKETLHQRIGALIKDNERLNLELEALRGRQEEPRPTSLEEFLEAMAVRADGCSPGGFRRFGSSRHIWTPLRLLTRRYGDDPGKLIAGIQNVLLRDGASLGRQHMGLLFLSRIKHPSVSGLVVPFARHEVRELREAAINALALQENPDHRELLQSVFNNEQESLSMRITAAGGLVAFSDEDGALAWLIKQHQARPRHSEYLRRRLLARILKAPLRRTTDFLVSLLVDEWERIPTQGAVLDLLRRLGTDEARSLIELAAVGSPHPEIRGSASRLLIGQPGK